ncbi:MAG: pyrroline-5-carboxylate reductase [Pseudomonadota bacterium]|nr:pyrroline-5-carboxylate reductase [Pseudomonadota bacterium]
MSVSPASPAVDGIAFVGGGNMAVALIGGLRDAGVPAVALRAVEIQPEARAALVQRFGVQATADPAEVLPGADVIVLAVKPQQLAAVCRSIAPLVGQALVLSIAAGIRTADIARWLGGHTRIVRAMPNTPALVRAGITGVYAMPEVPAAQRAQAEGVLKAVGEVVWVADERAIDAVTAISGSGPAYVFHFMEGLIAAGEQLGLDPEAARRLTLQTVAGAARLALDSPESPALLRARVTSPNGTTQAALESFAASDLVGAIARAVQAADRRAAELGDEFGKA